MRRRQQHRIRRIEAFDPHELAQLRPQLPSELHGDLKILVAGIRFGPLDRRGLRLPGKGKTEVIHAGDEEVELDRQPGHVGVRAGLETLDVVRKRLAQRHQWTGVELAQPCFRALQRSQRSVDIARQLQLLGRQHDRLLDLRQRLILAIA